MSRTLAPPHHDLRQPSAGQKTAPTRVRHLDQSDVARRLKLSPRTLEKWRWEGRGPQYLKLGRRVVYRLADIQAFKAERLRESTSSVVSNVPQ
ncbi:MAG: helix-turn-helix domain-containing protein [Rhodospirillales bacterium]|nr:helix-turn-helix domain-containing protein [Rhodospirillales bacterium]